MVFRHAFHQPQNPVESGKFKRPFGSTSPAATPCPQRLRRPQHAAAEPGDTISNGIANAQKGETPLRCTHVAPESTRDSVGLGDPIERFLASTSRGKRRRVGRKLQMAENLAEHLGRTGGHLQRKHPLQEPRPVPLETGKAGVMLVAPWTAILTTCAWRSPLGVPAAPCASSA
jgi:hypothetical protein